MKNQKNTPELNLRHPEVKPVCKNCKWWETESICDFIDTIPGGAAYKKGHGADFKVACLDDSGLWVQLKTGPDFGCVNFHPDGQGS